MKLKSVKIENYRAIEKLDLPLDPSLTVFHGANGCGKTSVLNAIAVGSGDMMGGFLDESTLDFCEEDWREGAGPPRICVSSIDRDGEFTWERRGDEWADEQSKKQKQVLLAFRRKNMDEHYRTSQNEMPIVAFYDTDRTASSMPEVPGDPRHIRKFSRLAALEGALSAHANFEAIFTWFYAKEDEELRAQKARRDFDYHLKDLSAVRRAISSMLPEVSDPRFELNPTRFVVSVKSNGRVENLALNQLSGGYRIVLALAADIARRMAQGNPHLDNPLESKAVVLIDEIELHLHPAWQQRVLDDLRRTFPNTQFIVSTHSPQVLTTVEPQRIVELYRDADCILAGTASGATYGAEAGDVLSVVMGVDERPPENKFTKALNQYRHLIREGQWKSEEALELREDLESMSPCDPALDRADLEIRRRELFKQMAKSQ